MRRFPVMAVLFTVCAALAAFTAVRLPEVYRTSARLLVEEPQIPESMVASTVRSDAVAQLDIIQQRLLTRANLIDIANRFDVYEDLRSAEPDTIVLRMQEDTRIRRSSGRDAATLMTITFEGRSGQIVANVVNEYVTLVLEANTRLRIGRAENTLDFFEQEAQRLGEELDAQSIEISAFRSSNSDALPENQTYRLGRQSLLQERLGRLERDLGTMESQREDIARIFEATGQVGASGDGQRLTPEQRQLSIARTDLQLSLNTYSAENPRVVRLQNVVDRLEAIVATQTASGFDTTGENGERISPAEAMFQATMVEIENRVDAFKADIANTQEELDALQQSIAASYVNGIQLDSLERDFQVIQTRYNAAVGNLNQAQMSERVEITAQGQRISVIENANVPRLPSGPNRPQIIALGTAVGAVLAGSFFVMLEILNRTVRRPAELISKFNVTPLTTIPYLESRARRTFRRIMLVLGSLIALVGVPLILWYIDTNYMPLDLLVQKVLARVGIL